MTLIAGWIGVNEQAAQTVVTTGIAVFFEVPLASGEATSALVGNSIGAGNVNLARSFYKLTTRIAFIQVTVMVAGIYLFRRQIAGLYSDDVEVLDLMD